MRSEIILIIGLVGFFWPILVSCLYLIFQWRIIRGKLSFLFITSIVGYILFIGVPFLLRVFLVSFFGIEKALLQELENPSHRWVFQYYWPILAIITLVVALLPILSTHYIYKKRLVNG